MHRLGRSRVASARIRAALPRWSTGLHRVTAVPVILRPTISELVFTSTSSWQLDRTRCTVKPLLSNQHLLTAYFAMFHSRVSCGIELWGGAAACRQVLLIQKKPIRVIYFWNILAVGRYGYDLDILHQYWGNCYLKTGKIQILATGPTIMCFQ